jgi:hypothetical protein
MSQIVDNINPYQSLSNGIFMSYIRQHINLDYKYYCPNTKRLYHLISFYVIL